MPLFLTDILALEGEEPPSKKNQENNMVFISYARQDSNMALRLYADLKAHANFKTLVGQEGSFTRTKLELRN